MTHLCPYLICVAFGDTDYDFLVFGDFVGWIRMSNSYWDFELGFWISEQRIKTIPYQNIDTLRSVLKVESNNLMFEF